MELANTTEEEFKQVAESLEAIGLKVPTGVKIMQNIVGICESISDGVPAKEIIATYGLKCVATSFAATFKKTTGVSVSDIPSMTQFDKRRRNLIKAGYAEDEAEKILNTIN